MRVLVTGGAGFIGSHVVDAVLAAGHEVLIVDSLRKRRERAGVNVPLGASLRRLDVRDPKLAAIFTEFRPHVVCHQAAQPSVSVSVAHPRFDAEVNVIGLINVLNNAVKTGVHKVVFASSAATYGAPVELPLTERTPQRPASPYGISKMTGEYYLRYFLAAHGLHYTILRYSNVYGARQDPAGEAGVVAIFASRILAGKPVRVTWDGEQTRDYVYVEDVASANVRALAQGDDDVFCIGTGTCTSINDLYRLLSAEVGRTVPIERIPKRSGDIRQSYFDWRHARQVLGWLPGVLLAEGLRRTITFLAGLQGAQ